MCRISALRLLLPVLFATALLSGAGLNAQGSLGVVAAGPGSNAVNPRTNRIYAVNSGGGSVHVIDGFTHAAADIPLPAGTFPQGLSINPVSNRIYVHSGGNQVRVLDGNSHALVNTLNGTGPVAFNLQTGRIYLLTGSSLRVYDAAETEIANVADVPGRVLAIDPLHNQIFVADNNASQLRVIDGSSHAIQTVELGLGALVTVAVNPQTRKVYVAHYGDRVTEVDALTLVPTPITVAENPTDLVVDPLLNKIYVAHNPASTSAANVTVIDGATRTTTAIAAGIRPAALAFDAGARRIYVSNYLSGSLTLIDADTQTGIGSVGWAAGVRAASVAVNPLTHRVYVESPFSAGTAVIDGSSLTVATHAAGLNASGVAYDSVQGRVITSNFTDTLTFVDPQTGATTPFVPLPGVIILRVLFDAGFNRIYAHHSDGRFSLIEGATLSVRTTPVISTGIFSMDLDPVRDRAFLVDYNADSVHVLSGADLSVTPVAVGDQPFAGTLDPASGAFYVFNTGTSNSITRIDGTTLATVTVAPSARPSAIVHDAAGNRLIIGLQNVSRVAVMDATTLASSADITLVRPAQSIAFNPRRRLVYIGHAGVGETRMSLLNSATLAAPTTIILGGNSTRTFVDAANDRVFAFFNDDASVPKLAVLRGPLHSILTRTLAEGTQAAVIDPLSGRLYFSGGSDLMRVDPVAANASTLATVITASGGHATTSASATLDFSASSGATPNPTTPVAVFYRRGYDAWSAATGSGGGNFSGSVALGLGAHYVQAFAIDGTGATTQSTSGLTLLANNTKSGDSGRLAGFAIARIVQTTVATTTTIGTIAPEPSVVGQSYSVAVAVTGSVTPSGSVEVNDGAGHNCSITLAAGAGSCMLTSTSAGAHTITAAYAAQGNFLASQDTESHQVDPAATATTIAADTPDPSVVGQVVTVNYSVAAAAPGAGTPAGDVTVTASGGAETCTGTVAAGTCQLTLVAGGSRTLTATYAGNASFSGSSDSEAHGVDPAPTATTILSDLPDPSAPGQQVTVQMAIAVQAPGAGVPAGALVATANPGGVQCSGPISAGAASCELAPTAIGSTTIIASFAGNADFAASQSVGSAHLVEAGADLSIAIDNGQTQSTAGTLVSYAVMVANTGPDAAPGARVRDSFEAAMTPGNWSCTAANGASCIAGQAAGTPASGSGALDQFVDLPSGGTLSLVHQAQLASAHSGSVTTGASVVGTGADGQPANNEDADTDSVTRVASVGIVKSNNCDFVPADNLADYRITASNAGPSDAPGTRITDPIATGFTSFQWSCTASGGAGCPASGNGAIDEFVSLPAGGQVQFVLLAFVPEGGPPTVTNTAAAAVAAGVNDPTPANNQSSDTDLVALFMSDFELGCD